MEAFQAVELAVPLWQLAGFVALTTFFMLFHKTKLCLITSYLFSFYWGLIYNESTISTLLDGSSFTLMVYLACGLAFVFLVIIAWMTTD
ncbi:MAG: hypothetical protein A3G93_02705 [Nitrospinae bacterium RIFCSPLOWO2_12_FULL_45_22]|nr:MAG: hypothetical protein A3G93_02705 [Nitrospinae bacterium RIFCSPLOWO2_12_FULL_45_22]